MLRLRALRKKTKIPGEVETPKRKARTPRYPRQKLNNSPQDLRG